MSGVWRPANAGPGPDNRHRSDRCWARRERAAAQRRALNADIEDLLDDEGDEGVDRG